jgi:tRNA 2-thiocytidine biosynthesis protein TtcA
MLDAWERETPGRTEQIARALGQVRTDQLADPRAFDFAALGSRAGPLPDAHAWLSGIAKVG